MSEKVEEAVEGQHKNRQTHVHEVIGSVMVENCLAKSPKKYPQNNHHTHRFATVTGEAMRVGKTDHIHEVMFRTDFYEDHYHEFYGETSGAILVGDRHVHYIQSVTSFDDGHKHRFRVATLIDNPTGD